MISFRFDIKNPFWRSKMNRWHRVYFEYNRTITKNKTFELCVNRHAYWIFEFDIDLESSGNDHAGPRFNINLFGYCLSIELRDNRHWNDEKDRWVDYTNEEEVKKYW